MLKQLTFVLGLVYATAGFAQAQNVSTSTYVWKKSDANVSLDLPKVENHQLQVEINARIQMAANKFFQVDLYVPQEKDDPKFSSAMEALYQKAQKESAHVPVKTDVFYYSIKTNILTETADLVSLQLAFYSNIKGAAHPISGGMFINFDPKTGKFIDNLSFLKPESQERVFQTVQSELEKKLKDSLYTKGEKLKELLPNHFGIKDHTLVFHFWPYDVAAYVFGPQTVEVPFSKADEK